MLLLSFFCWFFWPVEYELIWSWSSAQERLLVPNKKKTEQNLQPFVKVSLRFLWKIKLLNKNKLNTIFSDLFIFIIIIFRFVDLFFFINKNQEKKATAPIIWCPADVNIILPSPAFMLSSRSGLSQADVFITLWQMANSDYVNSQKNEVFFL